MEYDEDLIGIRLEFLLPEKRTIIEFKRFGGVRPKGKKRYKETVRKRLTGRICLRFGLRLIRIIRGKFRNYESGSNIPWNDETMGGMTRVFRRVFRELEIDADIDIERDRPEIYAYREERNEDKLLY